MRKRVFPIIISFLILALVFGSIGFVVAYYKYSGQIAGKSEMQRTRIIAGFNQGTGRAHIILIKMTMIK